MPLRHGEFSVSERRTRARLDVRPVYSGHVTAYRRGPYLPFLNHDQLAMLCGRRGCGHENAVHTRGVSGRAWDQGKGGCRRCPCKQREVGGGSPRRPVQVGRDALEAVTAGRVTTTHALAQRLLQLRAVEVDHSAEFNPMPLKLSPKGERMLAGFRKDAAR